MIDFTNAAKNLNHMLGKENEGEVDITTVYEAAFGKIPTSNELSDIIDSIKKTMHEYGLVEDSRG